MRPDFRCIRMMPAFAGLAAAVLLGSPAMAQDARATTNYANGAPEEVTVTSPRHGPTRSTIGAPIEEVSASAAVTTRDLNLHTGEGVYTLRQRVKYTARSVCNRLSFRYPIGAPDPDTCYRHAVERTTPQADSAIWNYRD